jgi:RsiW-degrading membrane proteinase PrsW (M82 family)
MDKNPNVECCVCQEPLTPPYKTSGGRAYCSRHFAKLNTPRPGFWRATLFEIVGVALLAALIALAANYVPPLTGTAQIVAGILLAIIPSAIWLVFFYRQDRLEPEPKVRIAAVFLLAALLTDVIARRVIGTWFQLPTWAPYTNLTSLLSSILIVGVTYQAIVYLAVRLLVYDTAEFDERMDGIVYGTVAGLGIAAVVNLYYVISNEGVALGPGVVNTVTTALAAASFGGLQGWFMGEAKFEHKPVWWVPLGFAITTVLNGLFSWLIGEVSAAGLAVDPWRSLLLGLLVAMAAFLVLAFLMRRSTEVTLRRASR